ncbi:MAG: HU family DNA-binding protein, partial [Acidobacteria bacterium ACB1]|nr:HU family DNA-binding protein [Acidobacteria bacterium ACB1]
MARMTQTEIISNLADSCGCKKTDVKAMFEALAALAAREVKKNGEFTIPGFGKLKKTHRKAREGRNPAT